MPKTRHEGTFENKDSLRLFYRFIAAEKSDWTLLVIHGHGEHSGRYEKLERVLPFENISIAAFDARGNGRSEGKEVYIDSFEQYLEDTSAFVEFLRVKYNVQKIKLLGHSLGGLTAVHWSLRNKEKINHLILSSPCLGLKLPPFLIKLNQFLCRLSPSFLYQNPVYPPHLSHSEEEIALYRKDKLIKRKMSVRLLDEMLRYMAFLKREASFDYPFPVHILMAGIEKVVDPGVTRSFFEKVHAPVKELIVFEDFYHEIFNEKDQDQVFEVLRRILRNDP